MNPSFVNYRQAPNLVSLKDSEYIDGDDTWAKSTKKVKIYN